MNLNFNVEINTNCLGHNLNGQAIDLCTISHSKLINNKIKSNYNEWMTILHILLSINGQELRFDGVFILSLTKVFISFVNGCGRKYLHAEIEWKFIFSGAEGQPNEHHTPGIQWINLSVHQNYTSVNTTPSKVRPISSHLSMTFSAQPSIHCTTDCAMYNAKADQVSNLLLEPNLCVSL